MFLPAGFSTYLLVSVLPVCVLSGPRGACVMEISYCYHYYYYECHLIYWPENSFYIINGHHRCIPCFRCCVVLVHDVALVVRSDVSIDYVSNVGWNVGLRR